MTVPRCAPAWLLLFSFSAAEMLAQEWTEARLSRNFLTRVHTPARRGQESTPFARTRPGERCYRIQV